MLGRLLILIAMMLFGPLFIEVYLYHPMIALEHDTAAIVPLVASPLALFGGFLLLAFDNRATTVLLAVICAIEVMVGVVGTAIHIALHFPATLQSVVVDPHVWLGSPPVLVPLSFAAGGCLALIPLAVPNQRLPDKQPAAIARVLQALAAACGLVGAIAGAQAEGGTIALLSVISAMSLGAFGFAAEVSILAYVWWRRQPV